MGYGCAPPGPRMTLSTKEDCNVRGRCCAWRRVAKSVCARAIAAARADGCKRETLLVSDAAQKTTGRGKQRVGKNKRGTEEGLKVGVWRLKSRQEEGRERGGECGKGEQVEEERGEEKKGA